MIDPSQSPEQSSKAETTKFQNIPRCILPSFSSDQEPLHNHFKSVLVEVCGELFLCAADDHGSAYNKLKDLFTAAGHSGDVSLIGAGYLTWKDESTLVVHSCESGLGSYEASDVIKVIKSHLPDIRVIDGD